MLCYIMFFFGLNITNKKKRNTQFGGHVTWSMYSLRYTTRTFIINWKTINFVNLLHFFANQICGWWTIWRENRRENGEGDANFLLGKTMSNILAWHCLYVCFKMVTVKKGLGVNIILKIIIILMLSDQNRRNRDL